MAISIRKFQKKKPDYREWKPYEGRRYWFIDSLGRICFVCWRADDVDRFRFSQNNCFSSEEDAKYYLKNLKVKNKLKRLAFLLNHKKNINWICTRQKKYQIKLKLNGTLEQVESTEVIPGQVYCLNEKFLNLAINKIGKENIVEMILSSV